MPEPPTVAEMARVVDSGLHPAVRRWRPEADRLAALDQELRAWVEVSMHDLDWARDFAAHQPGSGAPPERYLDRWWSVTADLTVLAGPRYRGGDPGHPFVGVVATGRALSAADLPALRRLARDDFAVFAPRDVRAWTADPARTWPGTAGEMRLLAAPLRELRDRAVPPELTARDAVDLSWYDRYAAVHARHVAADPAHEVHARLETRPALDRLRTEGVVLEVLLDGRWAGVLAAEPDVEHGLRGARVIELLLEDAVRGRGLGRHLSTLLARRVPLPDDEVLFGTIHLANVAALRSALGAGRIDVGGEVVIPVEEGPVGVEVGGHHGG